MAVLPQTLYAVLTHSKLCHPCTSDDSYSKQALKAELQTGSQAPRHIITV